MNVVTDRVLVLGLDKIYREEMKQLESRMLLPAARSVIRRLGITPESGVAEGYYAETEELQEYSGLLRAMQGADSDLVQRVRDMPEYQMIDNVCSSRLWGVQPEINGIVHIGKDSLTVALDSLRNWEVNLLTESAAVIAVNNGDYSLVGLAARIKDSVCIAAVRESTVLYIKLGQYLGLQEQRKSNYEWAVTSDMQESASKFVEEFGRLFGVRLPVIQADSAERYYRAYADAAIWGRCVRIGQDILREPPVYYYWAIKGTQKEGYLVSAFWSTELWTTERYRAQMRNQQRS